MMTRNVRKVVLGLQVFVFLLSYLLGSIPFALIIGKSFYGVDLREHGSFNLGATNAARVLGVKSGIAVALGDIGKGMLAALLPYCFHLGLNPLIVGIPAILGHCFPVFAGFRGGKAAATTAGVFLVANPMLFLTGLLTFVATIIILGYVALGTIFAGFGLFIHSMISGDHISIVITGLLALLLLYVHRSNIKNLLDGTEPRYYDERLKEDRIQPEQKSDIPL